MKVHVQSSSSVFYTYDGYISKPDADMLYSHCMDLQLDVKPPIVVYGKTVNQNRDVGFYSDVSMGYNYSRQIASAKPMTDVLRKLLAAVNTSLSTDFNGILINKYNNGSEYLGAHSDDERGLAKGSIVAGISLGAPRTFRIRSKADKSIVCDVDTQHGQLLVMAGEFQKEYTHEIPKRLKVKDPRISLTFRRHTQ